MNKKGIEKTIVGLLFVLVLIAFSFAERDSRKLKKLYTTAYVLKKNTQVPTVSTQLPLSKQANN